MATMDVGAQGICKKFVGFQRPADQNRARMTTHNYRFNRSRLWGVFGGLVLLVALLCTPAAVTTAYAQGPTAGFVGAWGWNSTGQLNLPPGLSDVIAIAGGGQHSLALRSTGTVVAWGDNADGQSTVPSGLSGVVAIAAGNDHSLALRSNGTVVAWGDNNLGQINIPTGLSNVIAISAGGGHSLALRSNGTVAVWGATGSGIPTNLSGVIAIAAGGGHSLALRSNGTVVAWGDDTFDQSTVPTNLSGVIAVAGGGDHSLALKSDGTVVAWGDNTFGQSTVPAGLNGVIAIAAGASHSLALRSNGAVVAWGANFNGQGVVPSGVNEVVAIDAGSFHNLIIAPRPSVTINQAASQPDPTNRNPLVFTASFSRPVTGFTPADVTLGGTANRTGATVTITGGPSVYTVQVNGLTSGGTVTAAINANVAVDALGISNAAATSTDNSVTVTEVAPSVTINQAPGQADPAGALPLRFIAAFSEAVTGFTGDDLFLNGTANLFDATITVSGGPSVYTVEIGGDIGPGTVLVGIPSNVAFDLAGNPNTSAASTDNTVTFTGVPPSVTIDQAAGQADPTSANPIRFTATFSKNVTNFNAADVILGGTANLAVATISVSGGPAVYTVQVTGVSGNGTVTARINANVAIDRFGMPNTASTSTDNSVSLDTTAPSVTVNQTAGQADPTNSNPIRFTAQFSEAVTDFIASDVTLSGTANRANATVTISGGPSNYTISVAGIAGSGSVVATLPANLVKDVAGNANLASTSTDNNITFDGVAPVVTINKAPGQISPTSDLPLRFTADFGEPVTGFTASDIRFLGANLSFLSGVNTTISGGPALYTITLDNLSGSGTVVLSLVLNAATDAAGNSSGGVLGDNTIIYNVPTPTPLPTNTPTVTPTPTATATPTNTPEPTATATATPTNTPEPTPTNTPEPTATATATPTNTSEPTATNTPEPTATPTAIPTETAMPTQTPTATPTNTPEPTATATNTPLPPTATPTVPATSLYATVQQVRNSLAALLPSGDSKTDQTLQKAIAKVDQGLSPELWQLPAGNQLSTQGEKAFHRLRDAIKDLRNLKTPPAAVPTVIQTLTGVGRTLAEQAVAAATTGGGNARQLAKANKELTKAQQDLARQRPDLAFSHYEEAWEAAQSALGVVLAASEPDETFSIDDSDHVHDELDNADESSADDITVAQQLFLPLIAR